MKGIVFITINEMIEKNYGIEAWETILNKVKPECQGIYISTADYPDAEVTKYVMAISEELGIDSIEVTRTFGTFLFDELNRKYDIFTKVTPNLFDFISSVENVIHKEVKKLYPNPSLPTLTCEKKSESQLNLRYSSPRKLCFLAEGLLLGAASYYNENISLHHDKCTHKGDEACEFRIVKND